MRKFLVLTALVAVGGMASASYIVAPFILDNGVSAAGAIGIFNLSSDDLTVGVIYNDGSQFRTPADNTFELGGNSSIGWHPGTNNPASEGADNPAPNMTAFRDLSGEGDSNAFAAPLAGAAIIYWDGAGGDIKGRYAQTNSAGSAFSYFLGEGVDGS